MGILADHRSGSLPANVKRVGVLNLPGAGTVVRGLWQRALSLDEHTTIASLGFLCLFGANFLAPTDPDFWWHLRTGQLIAETGALPAHDVFSYTAAGQPWFVEEWLSELVMYWLYAAGGYATLVAGFSLIITGAYFVLYRLLLGLGVDRTLSLAIVAWTAIVRWAHWAPRPQLITVLFFSITLYLLFSYKHRGKARIWLLPPMMIVWVNAHGGHIIGLLLIGLFAAGETLNRIALRPAAPLRSLYLVGFGSVLAALVNPYGWTALLFPLKYATTGNASTRYIAEWQSANFHEYWNLPFAMAIVLLMIVGSRGRFDFTHALVVLAITVMALQSQRHMVLFAMATAPVLALRLKERGVRLVLNVDTGRTLTPLLNLALLVAVPLLLGYVLITSPYSQARPTPSTASYPAGGVAYLKAHRLAGNLFNTYGWGGYLLYELYPDHPVFIDGRSDFYGDEPLEEYARVANITPQWREVLQRHQVATVLIEKDSQLAVLLSGQDDWRKVYEGQVEQIFVRQDGP